MVFARNFAGDRCYLAQYQSFLLLQVGFNLGGMPRSRQSPKSSKIPPILQAFAVQ